MKRNTKLPATRSIGTAVSNLVRSALRVAKPAAHPSLSIIMPTYNVEQYVWQAMSSVLAQLGKSDELLIVEDESSDGTPKIVERAIGEIRNARLIRQPHAGLGAARNRGLAAASGQYVVFLDSDDWLLPNAIRALRQMVSGSKPIDIGFTNWLQFDEKSGRMKPIKLFSNVAAGPMSTVQPAILHRSVLGKIWRRRFLEDQKLRFPEDHVWEDCPFSYAAYASADRVAARVAATTIYRKRRPDAASQSISQARREDFALWSRFRQIDSTLAILRSTQLSTIFPGTDWEEDEFSRRLLPQLKSTILGLDSTTRDRVLEATRTFIEPHLSLIRARSSADVRSAFELIWRREFDQLMDLLKDPEGATS